MVCLAVTRGGWGDVWLFDSADDAHAHALIQPGDAVIESPADVLRQYNLLELPRLLRKIGDDALTERVTSGVPTQQEQTLHLRTEAASRYRLDLFEGLERLGSPPPSDPAEIVEMVRVDRQLMKKESSMPENKPAAGAAATKPAAPAKTPRPPKYADGAKIALQADKDGKKYGKDNNPKREGSASATRFALYKDGMTVKSFVDAGGTLADIDNDVKKGYVKVAA